MNNCLTCGIFEKDGWEIENTNEDRYADKFPDAFQYLEIVQNGEKVIPGDDVLQCPTCKASYHYLRSTPGGSHDAMTTCYVERIIPITSGEANILISRAQPSVEEKTTEYFGRCPDCKSPNVDKIESGIIGTEVFVTMKCSNCGHEGTMMDEDQLEEWYR